jgi:hypothetical protein
MLAEKVRAGFSIYATRKMLETLARFWISVN